MAHLRAYFDVIFHLAFMKALAKAGKKALSIGKELGISTPTVYNILKSK